MNYSDFYVKATEELKSVFLSLNTKGDVAYRKTLEEMLENEPLVRKPVFQTIFPWESSTETMQDLDGLLGQEMVDALHDAKFVDPMVLGAKEEPQDFPKDRHPYAHQQKAWESAIKDKKSLLVTTGTGSGKTECFMVPILKELYDSKKVAVQTGKPVGVQAIFLYPLNALIASQRKRLHAWINSLYVKSNHRYPVTYAIYNGEMDETGLKDKKDKSFPQIIDRKSMRETPPQILFTNPSMLEYMMVRSRDNALSINSDLKWIVLDEAHCYQGSSATELALQIRRVLRFFGKKASEVRFAMTSATINTNPAKQALMHKFIEDLTGKLWSDFAVIKGNRNVEILDYTQPGIRSQVDMLSKKFNVKLDAALIGALRKKLNDNEALKLDDVVNFVGLQGNTSVSEKLSLVDSLSTPVIENPNVKEPRQVALLPTRAHFYVRRIDGVFACTNNACTQRYRPNSFGKLSTYRSVLCPDCGGRMLEVVRCSQCGELLLHGILDPAKNEYAMVSIDRSDDYLFDIDIDDGSDSNCFVLDAKSRIVQPPVPANTVTILNRSCDAIPGKFIQGTDYVQIIKNQKSMCPKCGEKASEVKPLMLSANMIQTHLAHILLDNSTPNSENQDTLYEGRNYISFTDNRQKTAGTARLQNVDVERTWIRGFIYHSLADQRSVTTPSISGNAAVLQTQLASLKTMDQNDVYVKDAIKDLQDKLARLNQPAVVSYRNLSPADIRNRCTNDKNLTALLNRFSAVNYTTFNYAKALLLDQVGTRSLRSASSLEALGLVHWVYPAIESINSAEDSFVKFYNYASNTDSRAVAEWKNLLKLIIDVTIRGGRHIVVPDDIDNMLPHTFGATAVYPQDVNDGLLRDQKRVHAWPRLENATQNRREFLIMLLAKGITNSTQVTTAVINDVNQILSDVWTALISKYRILSVYQGIIRNKTGYAIDLVGDNSPAQLSLLKDGWICPVTKQILDYTFMGLSPMIKGELCPETKARYSVNSQVNIPLPPFSRQDCKYVAATNGTELWKQDIQSWIETTFIPSMANIPVDVNSQVQIIAFSDIYLAQEHSAQLESDVLRESEQKFIEGKINVLDCSTTMEMGVDIGGLTVVTMNNIAPKPQNYQQRVGRAGRRKETKAMAMTIYEDSPIGHMVEKDPLWALVREIEPSAMSFESDNIVSRHVNAMFLASYLSLQSFSIKDYIGDFVMGVQLTDRSKSTSYNKNGFLNFLQSEGNNPTTEVIDNYKNLVKGTRLEFRSYQDAISNVDAMMREVCSKAEIDIQQLDSLINQTTNSKYKKKLESKRKNLWESNFIEYFERNNFLPSAYMPMSVTDLEIDSYTRNQGNPQRETHKALREYAPGKDVVVNELVYTSIGIRMHMDQSNKPILENVANCPSCGYVTKHITLNSFICPNCGDRLRSFLHGANSTHTQSIEPISFLAGEPTRKKKTSSPSITIRPCLLEPKPWAPLSPGQTYTLRSPIGDASVLFANIGYGAGYALCTWCGRMEAETGVNTRILPGVFKQNSRWHSPHVSAVKGDNCNCDSIQRNVILTAEAKTNLTEIRLADHRGMTLFEEKSLVVTLGTIMCRTLAHLIGVEEDEIDFSIEDEATKTFFIYDTHTGGSGYSSLLSNLAFLEQVFDECKKSLSSCGCSAACTNCLIDRRSQFNVNYLDRNLALEWLNWEFQNRDANIPSAISNAFNGGTFQFINSSIDNYLNDMIRDCNYNRMHVYFDSNCVTELNLMDSIEHELKIARISKAKDISMAVDNRQCNRMSLAMLCELQRLAANFDIYSCVYNQTPDISPIVCTDSYLIVRYIDQNNNESFYKISNYQGGFNANNLVVFDPRQKLVYHGYAQNRIGTHFDISNYLEKILGSSSVDLDNYMNGFGSTVVDFKYTDIYVNTPAACILLCNVIKQFAERYNLTIGKIEVNTGSIRYGNTKWQYVGTLMEEFANDNERATYLSNCALRILGCNVVLNSNGYLQHDRGLVISGRNSQIRVDIEPNAGFAHGWLLEDDMRNPASRTSSVTDNFFMYNQKFRETIKFSYAWG